MKGPVYRNPIISITFAVCSHFILHCLPHKVIRKFNCSARDNQFPNETMKSTVLFSWALLHLCLAHCPLHLPEPVLFDALNTAGLVGDDPFVFTLLDLTYLCYARSLVDVMRFDQVRVSVLYTYGADVPQSAQATFECIGITWRPAPVSYVTQHKHIFQDLTREGCQDCLDQSKFAKPTYCRCECI